MFEHVRNGHFSFSQTFLGFIIALFLALYVDYHLIKKPYIYWKLKKIEYEKDALIKDDHLDKKDRLQKNSDLKEVNKLIKDSNLEK